MDEIKHPIGHNVQYKYYLQNHVPVRCSADHGTVVQKMGTT